VALAPYCKRKKPGNEIEAGLLTQRARSGPNGSKPKPMQSGLLLKTDLTGQKLL